jgi:single-strand DNA-binding protein
VNMVSLIGNLATEVEVKKIDDERSLASFLLAVNRPTKDGVADFVGVTAWNRQAELCEQYLTKGKRVGIEGRLRSSSWDEEGKRRSKLEVVALHVQFLSPPDQPGEGAAADADIPFETSAVAA